MKPTLALGILFAAAPVFAGKTTLREPAEAFKALEQSQRKYAVSSLDELKDPTSDRFAELLWPELIPPLDRPRVVVAPDGSRSLTLAPGVDAAVAGLERGGKALLARDFDTAVREWQAVVDAYPAEPAGHSHLGDAFFFQGKYDLALASYQKASELVPDFYQPHLFRAHALYRLGSRSEALDAFALALALRPRHALTLQVIRNYAAEMGIDVLDSGFEPRAFVRKDGDGAAIFAGDAPWMAWAVCKAAWLVEPEYRKAGGGTDDSWTSREERECLAALLGVYSGMREEGEIEIDPTIERVSKVVDAGLVGGMILYEMGSRLWPDTILIQPPEDRAEVVRYVREFLLAPIPKGPAKR
jgi:tetratricopeptide (TPR) repeat protein